MASINAIRVNGKKNGKIIGYKFRGTFKDVSGNWKYRSYSWHPDEEYTPAQMRRKAQMLADEWEDQLRASENSAAQEPPKAEEELGMTFREYVEKVYLPSCAENRCRPITMENYARAAVTINKKIGNRAVAGLTKQDTQELLQFLEYEYVTGRGKYLEKSTIREYYTVYKQIIKKALEDGTLNSDPLNNIKPPKVLHKSIDALNQQEVRVLTDYTKNISVKDRAFILLCIFGGFRKNEVLGLKWEDIDFQRMKIRVVRGVTAIKGGLQIESPKTENSRRTVPLHRITADALKELYGDEAHDPQEYIFHARKNLYYPAYPSRYTKLVKESCAKANLPDMSPHDLRHTYATTLYNNGVDIKMVSEALGHSDPGITYKNYVHIATDHIAENVNKVFDNIMKPEVTA